MIKKLAALFFCCLIPEVNAAEEIYGAVPPVAPALSAYGQYKVGVRTIKVTHQGQLSATDFQSTVDRQLTLEVW